MSMGIAMQMVAGPEAVDAKGPYDSSKHANHGNARLHALGCIFASMTLLIS